MVIAQIVPSAGLSAAAKLCVRLIPKCACGLPITSTGGARRDAVAGKMVVVRMAVPVIVRRKYTLSPVFHCFRTVKQKGMDLVAHQSLTRPCAHSNPLLLRNHVLLMMNWMRNVPYKVILAVLGLFPGDALILIRMLLLLFTPLPHWCLLPY